MNKIFANILVLVASLLLSNLAGAQTSVYHPMPDSAAMWCENWAYGSTACYSADDYTLLMEGDTVLNGDTYHKIYATGKTYYPGCPQYGATYFTHKYYGALREDVATRKVYTVGPHGAGLEYDFNWQPGDSIPDSYDNIISYIDSVEINGNYRKRLWVGSRTIPADSSRYCIIEGIGSSVGLMMQRVQGVESLSRLNAFSQKGKAMYPDSTVLCQIPLNVEMFSLRECRVFPNPASNEVTIRTSENASEIFVTDQIGKEVLHSKNIGENNTVKLDVSMLLPGFYLVRMRVGSGTIVAKIVIDR